MKNKFGYMALLINVYVVSSIWSYITRGESLTRNHYLNNWPETPLIIFAVMTILFYLSNKNKENIILRVLNLLLLFLLFFAILPLVIMEL